MSHKAAPELNDHSSGNAQLFHLSCCGTLEGKKTPPGEPGGASIGFIGLKFNILY